MEDEERYGFGENVVLTGFMGTGKSTVGRLLADRLAYDFVDTDMVIERRHGPIAEIFETRGEAAFREMERAVASELSRLTELVVATGGGMMTDPGARASLEATGRVFCLIAHVDVILDRVESDSSGVERPLLAGDDPRSRIESLVDARARTYADFVQIDTTEQSPDEIAALIAEQLSA